MIKNDKLFDADGVIQYYCQECGSKVDKSGLCLTCSRKNKLEQIEENNSN